MKCSKCGTELNGTERFCTVCGTPVNAPQTPTPSAPQTPTPSAPQAAPARAPQAAPPNAWQAAPARTPQAPPANAWQAPPAGAPQAPPANAWQAPHAGAPVQPVFQNGAGAGVAAVKPKNKKKPLLILGIIAAIIALIAVIGFSVRHQIIRTALGETGYYAYTEAQTFSDLFSDDDYKALVQAKDITVNSELKITDDGQETVTAKLKAAYDQGKGKGSYDVSMNANGNEVGPIQVNTHEGKIGISSPSVPGQSITLGTGSEQFDVSELLNIVSSLRPVIKDLEKNTLAEKITVSKEEVDGKKYRTVTLSLSEKDCYNLAADLLEAISKQPELIESFKKLVKDNAAILEMYGNLTGDSDIRYIEESIDEAFGKLPELIESARKQAEYAGEDEYFRYVIYYKNSSSILMRKFYSDDTCVTVKTVTEKKEKALDIVVTENSTEIFNLAYRKSTGGKMTSFTLSASEYSDQLFSVRSDNLMLKKVNGIEVPTGTVSLQFDNDISGSITMTAGDTYNIDAAFRDEYDETIQVTVTTSLDKKADLSGYTEPSGEQSSSQEIQSFFNAIEEQMYSRRYNDYDYDYDSDYWN